MFAYQLQALPTWGSSRGQYQCDFVNGKTSIDQLIMFIDFKLVEDTDLRENLYMAMKRLGILPKLIRLFKMTTQDVSCFVRVKGDLSKKVCCDHGLRQRDTFLTLSYFAVENASKDKEET